ncbi:MAG: PHB depolymerase family esterase [Robiginitalea sp.]
MGCRNFLSLKAIVRSFVICLAFMVNLGCSGQSRLESGRQDITVFETLDYYLYYPAAYNEQPKERFPLLLFLHGGGESGAPLELIRENGPPKLLAEGKEFPFLILAPQNPHKKQWWNVRAVMELLDRIVAENRVDLDRIYLTGLSRGGNACWELAVQYPDTFAAMAVVCGMAPLPYAHWIYEGVGHNAWEQAYLEEELYNWFLQQSR